ncbi:MAG: hypothetical protein HY015_01850 [Bacteroidetes bacterium]|nr:hypothetical protein [Bacteroidota bacterium]MBI3481717.1 hypothetical protein [Bacteroidota bacterium]
MKKDKIKYFLRSGLHFFSPVVCPNCNSRNATKIDQKYLVTRLFRCDYCSLQFRHPLDSQKFNNSFYQDEYRQDDGITTDLPKPEELKEMIETDFTSSPKNVGTFVKIFNSIVSDVKDIKMVDYGSSWGYMSYQFRKRGMLIQSFEISKPRANYGNKNLNLDIKSNPEDLKPGNDIFFSSHVIEHVPSIPDMINISRRLLDTEGYFVAECPNGSQGFRKRDPIGFNKAWGLVHPSYLSEDFYQWLFKENPYLILTSPYDLNLIRGWDQLSQVTHKTDGDQLLVIARPNTRLKSL